MSNFTGGNGYTTYKEPEGTPFYRGQITLRPEYDDGETVGLSVSTKGGGDSVALGIKGEAEIQEFLYAAAVQARLIKEGDPLILMKKVSAT